LRYLLEDCDKGEYILKSYRKGGLQNVYSEWSKLLLKIRPNYLPKRQHIVLDNIPDDLN